MIDNNKGVEMIDLDLEWFDGHTLIVQSGAHRP